MIKLSENQFENLGLDVLLDVVFSILVGVICSEVDSTWFLDLPESPLASESSSVSDPDLNLIAARTEDVPDNGDSGRLDSCVSDFEDEQSLL